MNWYMNTIGLFVLYTLFTIYSYGCHICLIKFIFYNIDKYQNHLFVKLFMIVKKTHFIKSSLFSDQSVDNDHRMTVVV